MNSNIALAGTAVAVSSSLALGYFIGKFYGSRRYAEDYIQKPIRAIKRTEGLKVFLDYVAEYSTPEHPAVTELRELMCEKLKGFETKATGPNETSFLTQLAKAIGAKRVLEVGTFAGTTTLSIALALPTDGEMVTIDFKDEWAGVDHKIRAIVKDAAQALDELIADGEGGTYDMVYIDADKWNYHVYYDKCVELVRKGGLILLDDTLWGGMVCDPKINRDGRTWEVEPLDYNRDCLDSFHNEQSDRDCNSVFERIAVYSHAFNKKIVKDPRVVVNILPISQGLTIATKL